MARRYFCTVIAPSRRALVRLRDYDLDVFQGTAKPRGEEFSIDGLLTLEQVAQLADAEYSVLVREHSAKKARAPVEVADYRTWIEQVRG